MKLNEAIGKRIADLMKERGLTAYKLSRMGGVSKQLVYILVKAAFLAESRFSSSGGHSAWFGLVSEEYFTNYSTFFSCVERENKV